MNALRWHLHRVGTVLGLPGFAALALLAALAAGWLVIEQPAIERIAELQAENARLEAQLRRASARAPAAAESAQAALVNFEARFPDDKQITAVLARMRAIAARSGIVLERGEFKINTQADEALAQYVMVLPVKAEYRMLRRFMRELLREQPSMALEEVSLRRDDTKRSVVEAQLRFVLFVAARRS